MSRGNKVGAALGCASVCLAFGLTACAQRGPSATKTTPEANLVQELDTLREQLAERDRVVTQLESRLSLLEAEQRQLRYALAEREPAPAPVGLRETVRIGEARGWDDAPERPAKQEVRPVLRLYEDRRASANADGLQAVPMVSERLPVAPVPSQLGMEPARGGPADGYLAAIDSLRRRDFEAALLALDGFLAAAPTDPRAGRALFWRGEALFAQRQYEQALGAFQSSLSREPRGEKAADALLKVSLCHKRLGAHERARAAMQQLKAQFPQSQAARLAQKEEA